MDLSTVLREQGKFEDAWAACKEGERVAEQQNDRRGKAVALFHLGGLALKLLNPIEAYQKYMAALSIFHSIEDFTGEADTWNQLGLVAQSHKKWAEAERYFRESLIIRERLGDELDVARMCNNLGVVAEQGGNPEEAKGWYRRALEIDKRLQPGSPDQANHLNNFANILANEAKAKGGAKEILREAKAHAEEALSIRKKLGASSEIWTTFFILAFIADQEGRTEDAQSYRRLVRESFADFEGNRYYIGRLFGDLIAGIAKGAFGDDNARVAVINRVQSIIMELQNTRFKWEGMLSVVQRIWAGERDWQILAKELDEAQSLIILLALEKISS
jgi:tetratricopeptide (TPR) repeat protein